MLDIRAGNNKIFVRIASEEDPDLQKQSDFGLDRQLAFEILEYLP